jgi:NAD(P)-dependent dehydrogenase (short-subunit alcohol dehydrogenase family)
MDLSLQGKVALVTGGGRGLGRSIVRGLTQAGAHVVVTAPREIEEIERAASEAPKGAVAAFLADATFPKLGRSERKWRRSRNTAIFHGPPGTMR